MRRIKNLTLAVDSPSDGHEITFNPKIHSVVTRASNGQQVHPASIPLLPMFYLKPILLLSNRLSQYLPL